MLKVVPIDGETTLFTPNRDVCSTTRVPTPLQSRRNSKTAAIVNALARLVIRLSADKICIKLLKRTSLLESLSFHRLDRIVDVEQTSFKQISLIWQPFRLSIYLLQLSTRIISSIGNGLLNELGKI